MRELKPVLDRLYADFNHAESRLRVVDAPAGQARPRPASASAGQADPIDIVRRFTANDDREVVGFIAAALAFGRVASVLQSIERVMAVLGPRPAAYVRRFDPHRDRAAFRPIVHRWTRGDDIAALVWILHQMLRRSGSIEDFFVEGLDEGQPDLSTAIDSFSARALAFDLKPIYGRVPMRPGVCYFFPRTSTGSACKRLNLFLRWMVRHDALDLGVWSKVSPSKLIVPLDTHVIRLGRCLRLTTRTSPGWRMAADITASLRALDARDPVKYDFAICHLGMMNACGFNRAHDPSTGQGSPDQHCPLRGACHPRVHKPRRSRRPSARR